MKYLTLSLMILAGAVITTVQMSLIPLAVSVTLAAAFLAGDND